jgi:hypothetical protein
MKQGLFSWVIGILAVLISLIWPDSKATMFVFAEYAVAVLVMICYLVKNRKSIKPWQCASVTAIYAVPSVLLLIQKGGNIPMNSIMGRITIVMIAILMLASFCYKVASQEEAA